MPITTQTELADVFFGTAQKHASDRGYEFRNPTQIQQHARQGADAIFDRIQRNRVDPYHPGILRTITEAEYHEKRFVDLMIVNHRGRQGQGGILEDVDFQFSSSWLSPMWPFCT
jgi:hypothetical protein